MVDKIGQEEVYGNRLFSDINTRIRDLEEKQRLLRDKMLLIGESFVKEREKSFVELQEMKKVILRLQDENKRIREVLFRFGEKLDKSARREELTMLQRQFDLFRDK